MISILYMDTPCVCVSLFRNMLNQRWNIYIVLCLSHVYLINISDCKITMWGMFTDIWINKEYSLMS